MAKVDLDLIRSWRISHALEHHPSRSHLTAEPSPYPAYFSLELTGPLLRKAQAEGIETEIRTVGERPVRDVFLYYPVVLPVLDGTSTIDGKRSLPSGYGGWTSGGIPIWTHSGRD